MKLRRDIAITAIFTLFGILFGALIGSFVSDHFYSKQLKDLGRRLSFPITPADFLLVGVLTPALQPSFGSYYLDAHEVDPRWIREVYKKDKKGDWIWKICPRCRSTNTKKMIYDQASILKMLDFPEEGSEEEHIIEIERRYRLYCKDCLSSEDSLSAELNAEAILKFFFLKDRKNRYFKFADAMEDAWDALIEKCKKIEKKPNIRKD